MGVELDMQRLHRRATTGETVSPEERALLDAWYARVDAEEAQLLAKTASPAAIATLRAEVDQTVAQTATVSRQIQELSVQNAAVRQEIASLEDRLVRKQATQPAAVNSRGFGPVLAD